MHRDHQLRTEKDQVVPNSATQTVPSTLPMHLHHHLRTEKDQVVPNPAT
jgi:hypothetical protein